MSEEIKLEGSLSGNFASSSWHPHVSNGTRTYYPGSADKRSRPSVPIYPLRRDDGTSVRLEQNKREREWRQWGRKTVIFLRAHWIALIYIAVVTTISTIVRVIFK